VTIYRIKCPSAMLRKGEKLISDSHPDSDRHQNLTIEGHPLPMTTVFG